jgi:ABC-2 type transport system permease protein
VRHVNESTYYVAAMAVFGVISACYSNLAVTITVQREAGILKRTDGTTLPGAVFLGARVLHAVAVAALLVIITAAFGHLAYGAGIPTGAALLRCLASLLVGAASFSALGFAVTARWPDGGRSQSP